MSSPQKPSLFGLTSSNRDFTSPECWGKNQFNSSFPASLCCYLAKSDHSAVYICLDGSEIKRTEIAISKVFGTCPMTSEIYFAFESPYIPFQKYIIGELPRTDLVILKNDQSLAGLEIKLTAIPDSTTYELSDAEYGSELVVRPDSIAYLACTLADSEAMSSIPDIGIGEDYADARRVLPQIEKIIDAIRSIGRSSQEKQTPFLVQPVWKTIGKSPILADNCLDVFVWSNCAFVEFICCLANPNQFATSINRQTRTAIWLYKMLLEIKLYKRFNHAEIIDRITYNTKNDKAFASSGAVTNSYMKCPRLEKPLITKNEIKNIILGGGQNLLSPERRFDSIIVNSPDLFT
jgi:HindVP restriction endonuclease